MKNIGWGWEASEGEGGMSEADNGRGGGGFWSARSGVGGYLAQLKVMGTSMSG